MEKRSVHVLNLSSEQGAHYGVFGATAIKVLLDWEPKSLINQKQYIIWIDA